jgi:hypothetical protein
MRPKDILFKTEQEKILIKILKIIGLNGTNNKINREDLLRQEIIEKIKEIEEDIRHYYCISKFRSYSEGKDKYLNLIRNICKHNGLEILKLQGKRYETEEKIKRKTYVIYHFIINNDLNEKMKEENI